FRGLTSIIFPTSSPPVFGFSVYIYRSAFLPFGRRTSVEEEETGPSTHLHQLTRYDEFPGLVYLWFGLCPSLPLVSPSPVLALVLSRVPSSSCKVTILD
ncbi:hypothetical protein LINPERHAP2_LOCUS42250, partial [Linum perenne]